MLFWPHSAHHFGTSEPRIQAEMGPSGPHSQARCSHCCFNLTDENFSNPHSLSAQNMKMALLAPLSPSLSHNFDHPSSLRYDPPARANLGIPEPFSAFLGIPVPFWTPTPFGDRHRGLPHASSSTSVHASSAALHEGFYYPCDQQKLLPKTNRWWSSPVGRGGGHL